MGMRSRVQPRARVRALGNRSDTHFVRCV